MPDYPNDSVTISHNGKKSGLVPNYDESGTWIGGRVVCRDQFGNVVISLNGGNEDPLQSMTGGTIIVRNGAVIVNDRHGHALVRIYAEDAPDGKTSGRIAIGEGSGDPSRATIVLSAVDQSLVIRDISGNTAVTAKAEGAEMNVGIPIESEGPIPSSQTPITLSGSERSIILRDKAVGFEMVFPGPVDRIRLDANQGNLWVGGNDQDGDIVIFPKNGDNQTTRRSTIHLDGGKANVWLGGSGENGDLCVFASDATDNHDAEQASIRLDGKNGDIILRNADCAEEFEVAKGLIDPGTVMVLDDDGTLRPSHKEYDHRVAGIVSGASGYRPGIVLDKQKTVAPRLPIALMGKVFCKVEASAAPIKVGDLLTTSPVPGHAMKAGDQMRAFGAVLGKALGRLESGRGLIPVLVALQ